MAGGGDAQCQEEIQAARSGTKKPGDGAGLFVTEDGCGCLSDPRLLVCGVMLVGIPSLKEGCRR